MKKKIYFLSFSILFFANCSTSQVKQEYEGNIEKYLDMEIALSQDTALYGDEITLNIIFKNKSDSTVSFFSRALLLLDRYYSENRVFENPSFNGRFLTAPPFFENLTTLLPQGIHEEIFTFKIDDDPLFSKKIIVHYVCARGIDKRKRNDKNEKNNMLFGELDSPPFEIYIKEN